MKAIVRNNDFTVKVADVPMPDAIPGHLLIKVHACAINSGDKVWLRGDFPPGAAPESRYDVAGGSGAGEVIGVGDDVPEHYRGKKVAFYRSLKFSDDIVGAWSEYACLHYLHCVLLSDDANLDEYSGSLVNVITPYAFYQQVSTQGYQGIICTAGTAATGRAMIGICKLKDMPCIALVRNIGEKQQLMELGASPVLTQDAADFERALAEQAAQLGVMAVYDGVGGQALSRVAGALPPGSGIYAYGFLGGDQPFCIHTSDILMKNLRICGFGNFTSDTVTDPQRLEQALQELSKVMYQPYFKTAVGRRFRFEEIEQALAFRSPGGERALLVPDIN